MSCTSIWKTFMAFAVVALLSLDLAAHAASIRIDISGLDLIYDYDGVDAVIHDAGSIGGGDGDPADSDPLTSVTIEVDNVLVDVLTTDIFADVGLSIPPIPMGGGLVTNPLPAGIFDLLTSSIAPGWGLAINIEEVQVSYTDLGFIQFVFGGAIGNIFDQNLPSIPPNTFVGNPVTVSFAAQVSSDSVTNDGTFLTGFTATGAGTIQGNLVPEPATCSLIFLATSAMLFRRQR